MTFSQWMETSIPLMKCNVKLFTLHNIHNEKWSSHFGGDHFSTYFAFNVVPPGIEPGTHGFSVRCSTD